MGESSTSFFELWVVAGNAGEGAGALRGGEFAQGDRVPGVRSSLVPGVGCTVPDAVSTSAAVSTHVVHRAEIHGRGAGGESVCAESVQSMAQ